VNYRKWKKIVSWCTLFFLLVSIISFNNFSYANPLDDIDGDGVINLYDLDDDNDGISDVDESWDISSPEIQWNHNWDPWGQSDAASYEGGTTFFSSAEDLTFWGGLFENPELL